MICDFVIQLSKLRKLSAESVENTSTFAPFKEYLHVERSVEKELRELLQKKMIPPCNFQNQNN